MQVFEFHFNPAKPNRIISGKDDLIFDSFCFEPENIYEKRMGSLYIVGLLKNVLPQNIRFLDVLAQKIKEKYYQTVSLTPEKSLRDALRIANEYLEKIAKQGDVSWLGNLRFAVISLTPLQKSEGRELNFTKVGDLKIFLIRGGQIIDIEQKLRFADIEPYPLKIFGNIVSGKLAENDILLVLSKEVSDVFLKENLLSEIARKSIKKFKALLNGKKEQLTKISGICLLMVLSRETAPKEKETLSEKRVWKIFSLPKEIFNPLVKIIKNFRIPKPRIPIPKISFPKISFPKIRLRIPYKFPARAKKVNFLLPPSLLLGRLKRKIILVLLLILFLALGFFIFEKREEEKLKTYQIQIEQIQEKISQAESYLILAEYNPRAKKNAQMLYKEAWDEISQLPSFIASQVSDLKNAVSENLERLNKLVEIPEPELIFEFKAREPAPYRTEGSGAGFIPQRLISFKEEIFFFTPYSENIFKLNRENQGEIIEINKKFSLAISLPNSVIFFSKPNQIIILKENQFSETIYLEELSLASDFTSFASYRSHLYFLDSKNKAIIRYPFISESNWGTPEPWLAPEIKTAFDFKSMAVDGSIWILAKGGSEAKALLPPKKNAIERYYAGRLQETIVLDIFPEPKTFSKIFTSSQHPYLYLLEPVQKRVVILDKSGQIIKQYQSQKFDNLLDFSVSEDGKTIYLLNGLKVYQINFILF